MIPIVLSQWLQMWGKLSQHSQPGFKNQVLSASKGILLSGNHKASFFQSAISREVRAQATKAIHGSDKAFPQQLPDLALQLFWRPTTIQHDISLDIFFIIGQ
jgi:hypothetical protein